MKFYGHKGSSTDNAFTVKDGIPVRTFMAFNSKEEREEYRNKIWNESGNEENLIDCTRKFVEEWNGKDFFIAPNKIIYSDYESYELAMDAQKEWKGLADRLNKRLDDFKKNI